MPQWQDALTKANTFRIAAKNIREQMKAGKLTLGEVLEEPTLRNWPLDRVTCWQPGIGPQRAKQMLGRAGFLGRYEMPLRRLSAVDRQVLTRTAKEWMREREKRR